MSNEVYDGLKWFVMVVLPALETLYAGVSQIFCLPYTSEVLGVMSLVEVFCGSLVGVSSSTYRRNRML